MNDTSYFDYFNEWFQRLETSLTSSLPALPDGPRQALVATCRVVQSATATQQAAVQVRDDLQQPPVDPSLLEKAQHTVDTATVALSQAWEAAQDVAVHTLLDTEPLSRYVSDYDDADFVLWTVFSHATVQGLADWCDSGPDRASQLVATCTNDVAFLRRCLESGGARSGKYGRAMELYHQLVGEKVSCTETHAVLERLALAVALELADPYPLFNETGVTDAVQRYIHYEQSYLLGELDVSFDSLNVWELRQVVNGDATEDELCWGRDSLLAYRPDIALRHENDDPKWQYTFIVRSDVDYKDPDFYKSPRSYDQILSGGGKCGPRAWYGRFITKAFGIPTWGVRQPGHAAMARWTRSGWQICLGAGFDVSWWDDQGGTDFVLETQARQACPTESVYAQKVLRLQWMASFCKENFDTVRRLCTVDPDNPWCTLEMLQRRRLASQAKEEQPPKVRFMDHGGIPNKLASFQQRQTTEPRPQVLTCSNGTIIVPAASCSNPTTPTANVMFLPCFLGGQQLFLKEDAVVEYTIPQSALGTGGQYNVSCRVATAHRQEQPISLTINSTVYEIKLPYTMAMWGTTEPVVIALDGSSDVVLQLARPMQQFGFSLRDMTLTQCND